MGVLSPQGARDWHPAPDAVFSAGDRVRGLCAEEGLNVAEVALRFALDYEGPHSTLIGVGTEEQLSSSLSALDSELSPELLASIDEAIGDSMNLRWHDGLPENYD